MVFAGEISKSVNDFYLNERPLVLAHRGALRAAPENTIPAFEQALMQGADGVELDVTLSRDGEVVIIHDDTLQRTTNGRGRVADLTLAELRQFDAGAWFDERFVGTRIPTLAEALAALPAPVRINVELKAPPYPAKSRLAARALAVVRAADAEARVLFSSFSPWMVQQALAAGVNGSRLALLAVSRPLLAGWLAAWGERMGGFTAIHPWRGMLTDRVWARYRERGWRVNPWYGAKETEAADDPMWMAEQGAGAIITNEPGVVSRALGVRM